MRLEGVWKGGKDLDHLILRNIWWVVDPDRIPPAVMVMITAAVTLLVLVRV
jgi:hypothetical protein